tara:strand:+ start:2254 stop:3108 length:855 start_codon:yes stop_codon:yes gene_type:complete
MLIMIRNKFLKHRLLFPKFIFTVLGNGEYTRIDFRYFYTIWTLAWYRNLARFRRTHLGSLWIGLTNLLQVSVFAFVYGVVFKVPSFKEFFIYLGFGITIWTFMAGCVSSFSNIYINERNRLLNFPGSIYDVLAEEYIFHIQVFIQSLAMLLIVILIVDGSIMKNIFISILPASSMFIGVFSISIIVSIFAIYIKDFAQVIPVILNLLFLTSPIMYPKEALGNLDFVPKFNLLYFYLDPLRNTFINGDLNFLNAIFLFLISISLFLVTLREVIKRKFKIIALVSE